MRFEKQMAHLLDIAYANYGNHAGLPERNIHHRPASTNGTFHANPQSKRKAQLSQTFFQAERNMGILHCLAKARNTEHRNRNSRDTTVN